MTIGEGDMILRATFQELRDNGQEHILLDLEKVPYMDSSGIGELIAGYKQTRARGGTVKLLNVSGKVRELLELTRLDDVFETFCDEKEALSSF